MKELTNIRVFLFKDDYITVWNSEEGRFTGPLAPFLEERISFMRGFNVSVVSSNDFVAGHCKVVNNCTGFIGFIQRGEVDVSMFSYPLTSINPDADGIVYGPSLIETACYINSALQEVETNREDIMKSFSIFAHELGWTSLIGLLLLCLIPLLLHLSSLGMQNLPLTTKFIDFSRSSENNNIWPLTVILLGRDSLSLDYFIKHKSKSVFILASLASLLLTIIYSGSFTTDLSSKPSPKVLDNLDDVVEAMKTGQYIPVLLPLSKCNLIIESGTSPTYQFISKHSQPFTIDHLQSLNPENVKKYINLVTSEETNQVQTVVCATSFVLPREIFYKSTKPFHVSLEIAIRSSKLSASTNRKITSMFYKIFESRLYEFLESRLKVYLNKMSDPGSYKHCLHKIGQYEQVSYDVYGYNPLIFDNYEKTLIYFFLCQAVALVVFILELFVHRFSANFQNHQFEL